MALSNRTSRILVAILAIPVLLFAALAGHLYFLAFVLIIATFSFYEFSTMLKNRQIEIPLILGEAFVILFVVNVYFHLIDFEILVLLVLVFLTFYELIKYGRSPVNNIGAGLFGIFYIGLFASSLVNIREFFSEEIIYIRGGLLIVSLFVSLWLCDSAAYFLGTALGKHKIYPKVSPKKSWEGAISGFVFSILGMIVMREFFVDFLSLSQSIVLGGIFGIVGQAGDFIESMIKRDAGVKDSSSIIPGHGGVFDRFDSLLYSAPFLYLFLIFFYR